MHLLIAEPVRSQNLDKIIVTVGLTGQPLKSAIKQIESQTEFRFAYIESQVNDYLNLYVSKQSRSLLNTLELLLKTTRLTYEVRNNNILIVEKARIQHGPVPEMTLTQVNQETNNQEEIVITGKVTSSENGEPMPGVSVQLKALNRGTTTNEDGDYTIRLSEKGILVFNFVGYREEERAATQSGRIDVQLTRSENTMDDVVVVGYGTQRKATLTGSVASISSKELTRSPAINISHSISGLMPGVVAPVRSGEPGRDDVSILIRGRSTTGDNSPLFVIDGVPGRSGWSEINPNDIESISVLKDASAAIYGAQAANGVILVTTKRGKSGKPTITYTFNQGFTKPTRLPRMAGSGLFAEFVNQTLANQGQQPRYTNEEIQKFKDGSDPANYPDTKWLPEVLKPYSTQSQHNLALRGGTENVTYSVSGSYSNQEGIFKRGNTNFKTYSIRSNLDARVNKYIKVSVDLAGSRNEKTYPAFSTAAVFQFARSNFPYLPVYFENGLPSPGVERGNNPALMATDSSGYDKIQTNRIQSKASVDIVIPWIEGLSVDGFFAYDLEIGAEKLLRKPWTVYNYNRTNNTYIPTLGGGILLPDLREYGRNSSSSLLNMRVKYDRRFNNHNISAFIAGEKQLSLYHEFEAYRKDFVSTSIDELFAGSSINAEATGRSSESARKNVFGRLSYGFSEKYLLDFNFRYDGSSNFPPGNRYGFFPGVSAAWRISREDFMKDLEAVSELKIRGSVGELGNDRIPPFEYISAYTLVPGYSLGQTPTLSQGLTRGVSPNLNSTWEVARTSNLGIDAEFANGSFGFTADVFKTKRSNILAKRDASVPVFTGIVLPNENIGSVENKGVELEVYHRKTINKFSYRVAGNIGLNKSKVLFIDEPSNIPVWQKLEGHLIGATRFYKAIGIYRSERELAEHPGFQGSKVGDLKYEDINGDRIINSADQIVMDKTNIPGMVFGLNISMSYKNFSFFTLFQGQSKAYQYILPYAGLNSNALEEVLANRYVEGSMDSKYPRLPSTASEVSGLRSDFWLNDASFVRLKTLELAYTLPSSLLSRVNIQNMRVYVNGFNLITIDKLKSFDPEGNSETGDFYPQNKIFNVGLNLSF